jgi:hypothetical protein
MSYYKIWAGRKALRLKGTLMNLKTTRTEEISPLGLSTHRCLLPFLRLLLYM